MAEEPAASQKVKHRTIPYDLAIPLVGIYPENLRARTRTEICIPTLVAALLTVARRCKQPRVHQLMNG